MDKKLTKRIKELEDKIKKLEKDLIHDPLTKLKTRRFLEEQLSIKLDTLKSHNKITDRRKIYKEKKYLGIIFLDIDFFKKINDKYGHDVGDKVLIKVAKTINSSVRNREVIARWGGEEIMLLLFGINNQNLKKKAEKIRKNVEEIIFSFDKTLKVTISLGVTSVNSDTKINEKKLIKKADQALYRSKTNGRNQVTYLTAS